MMHSRRLGEFEPPFGEFRSVSTVYSGMRVLCVARHEFLSEHLCRFFRQLGADCTPVVGTAAAAEVAARVDPEVVVADCDLLSATVLDQWSVSASLSDVPVLAVSLTRRPEDGVPSHVSGLLGVVYLPALELEKAAALLAGVRRPRGVVMPDDAALPSAQLATVSI